MVQFSPDCDSHMCFSNLASLVWLRRRAHTRQPAYLHKYAAILSVDITPRRLANTHRLAPNTHCTSLSINLTVVFSDR